MARLRGGWNELVRQPGETVLALAGLPELDAPIAPHTHSRGGAGLVIKLHAFESIHEGMSKVQSTTACA
eukprot:1156894-Pelagomonas_calceolata.AAC.11